ncbi:Ribokinase-like protein [Mytilinidion resinicola]|uniref:Ribokinase-like protein n=1 Tax=Mytilinidion resinicola TaxID=574789 RepID=A0A6A6YDW6_9PEZI|nr:Ribokinase-like protein [Mytilinidion resinicola]KAF2807006.1 Ribokinase-like protein [Mytilinidion resinicola]
MAQYLFSARTIDSPDHDEECVPVFTSLGMIVLDEIRFPGKAPMFNVIGGSGAYATLGARLFSSGAYSKGIGCLVLAGKDFPQTAEDTLRNWALSLTFKRNRTSLSTRGLLEYEDTTFGPKKFRYTTEPLKATPKHLQDEPRLLHSKSFHLLASTAEVEQQVPELMSLRRERGITERPYIIWEPIPGTCKPENRQAFLDACKLVDVFSPNDLEITALFTPEPPKSFRPAELQSYAQTFLEASIGHSGQGCIVIRAGEYGCLTMSRSESAVWLPPFYELNAPQVIDPTGAGNAFLGGFAFGLQRTKTLAEAAAYGNVAATFALEQIGLPRRESNGNEETWNDYTTITRLDEYKSRLEERKL